MDRLPAGKRVPPGRFPASRFWRLLPGGMRRRWWLFRAFDLIVRHWPVRRPKQGVLVVRMDGIGDMTLFRPSLDGYARALGVEADEITVLGCTSWGAIADQVFAGYRVIAIDEHAFARNPVYRFLTALRVRRLNPRLAVCDAYFRRALMADSLVWLSAAAESVVSLPYISERTRPEFTYYLSQVDTVIDTGPYPTHELTRHRRFVEALAGTPVAPAPPVLAWAAEAPPVPAGRPYVVLIPGSNEPGRRWPARHFADLAGRLCGAGYRVVYAGAAADAPETAVDNGGVDDGVVDLFGRTSLPRLLDLIAGAAGVVSNDTGPAHIAAALGAPTVVVVGGGHFGCFVPYPAEATPPTARFVHAPMDCYHCFWRCHKRSDPTAAFPCVAEVGTDTVWAALVDVLGAEMPAQASAGGG